MATKMAWDARVKKAYSENTSLEFERYILVMDNSKKKYLYPIGRAIGSSALAPLFVLMPLFSLVITAIAFWSIYQRYDDWSLFVYLLLNAVAAIVWLAVTLRAMESLARTEIFRLQMDESFLRQFVKDDLNRLVDGATVLTSDREYEIVQTIRKRLNAGFYGMPDETILTLLDSTLKDNAEIKRTRNSILRWYHRQG